MSKPETDDEGTPLDLIHLRREARTALELAVVAPAPGRMVDELAACAGLFEALVELPPDSPPVLALVPKLTKRSQAVLDEWQRWRRDHLASRA